MNFEESIVAAKKKHATEIARQKIHDNVTYEKAAAGAVSFLAVGALFYHYVEKLSWVDAFYFTGVTLTTVGYGDISPKTDIGKVFTVFYILIGITFFVFMVKVVLDEILVRASKRRQK